MIRKFYSSLEEASSEEVSSELSEELASELSEELDALEERERSAG